MKDILTNEAKQFIIVKVDANGEPEGVLTRRTSTYGASEAISPFDLVNISIAVKSKEISSLQYVLDNFLRGKKTYKYADFKFVEMETKTTIIFGKEVEVSNEKEKLINNNRKLIDMAREWGKEWKKNNPNEDAETWEARPFGSEIIVNPLARKYFDTKMTELNWQEGKDCSYSAKSEAYEAFVKKIKQL